MSVCSKQENKMQVNMLLNMVNIREIMQAMQYHLNTCSGALETLSWKDAQHLLSASAYIENHKYMDWCINKIQERLF